MTNKVMTLFSDCLPKMEAALEVYAETERDCPEIGSFATEALESFTTFVDEVEKACEEKDKEIELVFRLKLKTLEENENGPTI